MAKLPFSRTVLATVNRNDNFATKRGFGTAILLAAIAPLTAGQLTKAYGSMEEIAADFSANSTVYAASLQAFSVDPRPVRVKIAFVGAAVVTSAGVKASLDAIYAKDSDFYFVAIDKAYRDTAVADGVIEWTEAKSLIALVDTNDARHLTPTDAANISARYKDRVERTATIYHAAVDEYPGFALGALLSTFNFDESNSAYTAKYKRLGSLTPTNVGVAGVTAATGFVEQIGQSEDAGHMANVYVDIGGLNMLVEGSTLTPNVFIDEIHATDYIVARTQEEALSLLANNKRIPYTDAGMATLASSARIVMAQCVRAGLIADDINPNTGLYEPAVEYIIPSVFDVPESQRKRRVAPDIQVRFRYAGAVHYTTIRYQMTF